MDIRFCARYIQLHREFYEKYKREWTKQERLAIMALSNAEVRNANKR